MTDFAETDAELSKPAGVDLADLSTKAACDRGFELELKHPATDEPLGVFIGLLGKHSARFQELARKRANARIRQSFQMQRKGKDIEVPTLEQNEREEIDLFAACTTHWRTRTTKADPAKGIEEKSEPTILHGGKALQFSEANAKFLYAEPWIREQVDEGIGDLGNFMPS